MWGYSFEDLARRAQEEAARLAEQASSSTGFLNLDSMNPDDTSPSNNDGKNNYANPDKDTSADEKPHGSVGATHGFFGFSTPQNTASSFFHGHPSAQDKSAPHVVPPATTEAKLRESESKPTAAATEIATASATKVHTTPIVTKLPSAAESDDFDPNSWGEDDDNIFDDPDNEDIINTNMDKNVTKISNDDEHLQLAMGGMTTITEDSDEMAERMREESRKLAEQIMLEEEEQRMKMKEQQQQQQLQDQQRQQNEGSQHPEAQADNGYREQHSQLKQHQQDHQKYHQQQRIDPSDLEAEQLREQSRLAAEAIMKADLVAEGRPCEDSGRERREGKDETAVREAEGELAEEATFAEQARIAEEEVAAEAERQRLEEKRLAEEARFAEEEAAAEAERQRLEEERLAEEARLAEEEAAAEAERQRFEEERLVEEARLAEEEVAAEAERQRLEEERLAEEARIAEEEAAAEAERQRLEEERLAEEARIAEEEAAAEAERQRLEEERLAEEARLAEEEAAAEAERQRLEEKRLAEEARLAEEEAAAEAERQRLEEERLEKEAKIAEEEAAAEAERQRLEEERLAEEAGLAEDEAAAEAERQRLEEERLVEEARLAEEEAAAEEKRQRLEEERLAEEARIAEEDSAAEAERQRLEEERLADDARFAEEEAAAEEKRQRLEEERLAEEARLAEEEAAAEAERQRLEEERLAEEARIAEEEAAAEAGRQRLEEERLAEKARIAEEEAAAEAERQRLEEERLADDARFAEEEAAAEEKRQRLEEERLAEEARLAEEEAAAEAERQRLEEERLAEEARLAEEEAAAEAERQRLEEERLADDARLAEEEAAAEAERQRLEEERLEEEARIAEEEAAAEAERQRLEEERLAEEARLAEEEAAAEAERQRLEEERLAEEARLVEEEAAAEAERQRLEEERLAEDARLAEEEAAAEAGRQRLEEERLAEEARLAEEDAAAEADCLAEDARLAEERAAAEAERQRLEEERLAEEARLAEEEAVVEAERQRLEEERFSKKSSYADNAECQRLEVEQFANEGKITVNDASAETDHQNLEEEKLPNLSQQHPFSQNDFFIQASCEKTCSGENVVENGREDDSNADVNVDDFDGMRPDVGESDCNTMLSIKVVKQKRSDSQFVGNLRNETEDTSESEKTGPAISTVELCTAERMDHTEDAITRLTLHESESEKFEGLSVEETESIRYTSRGTVTEFEGDSLKQNDVLNEEENELELRGSSDESLSQKNDAQQRTETNVDQQNTQSSTTPSLQSLFGSHATQLLEASNAATNMFSWGFNTHNVAKTVKGANNEGSPPNKDDTAPVSMMKNSNDGIVNESDEMCISGDFDDLYNDNELDDMYDDDEETDEEIEKNIQSSDTKETTSEKSCSLEADDIPKGQDSSGNIPQAVLDNFMKQLERLNESHQLEMNELLRSHKIEVERLENELSKEREFKNKAKARAEVASQDKYLGQMRELEKKFNATLKEKEDELEEVIKRNEGMTLKMDSMKREVEGLAKIVDERDDEICRLKQGHGTTMMQVEGKVKVSQEELARKDAEIMELKSSMSAMKADLDSTSESYDTLKARAKTIATELKDRRVEVRTLTSQNEELRSLKVSLETQVTNLRALVNQHELTISYKDKDMEVLYEKMKEMTKQLEGKDKSLQDRSAVGEKAIASYKRKAQEALAAANARLASANQAREEAESDAKSAKLAADDAVERARMAEARRTEAEKSRNELASQLEEERSTRTKEIAELKDSVEKLNETIALMEVEANETHAAREILIKEIDNLETKLSEEREKSSDLREKLIEEKTLCDSLQREVHDLHDEVQRSSAAAFKRAQNKAESTPLEKGADNNSGQNLSVEAMNSTDRSEADGTIIMLQQELQGANDAIMELKLALRTALLEKTEKESIFSSDNGDSVSVFQNEDNLVQSHNNDNTPLFFAIEKQNELNTAREEINRLASMLGDAESEKQEAFDAMEQMRQKMEEANARLLRYEKLGMQTARSQHTNTTSSSYGPFRSIGSGSSYSTAPRGSVVDSRPQLTSGHDSVVNLEYLKNVMLSYLKAKTLAEKRKLVPVIGTVLCLTPEEQAQAVDSVEQSAGLGGVASSFWENLESKAHNFM